LTNKLEVEGNMRGGMGNMQNMMKQMQKMQKKMAEAQEELGQQKIEGTAGGGMVTVIVTGHKEVVDVQIKPEAVDPDDIEMLQDLVLAATNDALKKVEELTNNTMGQFTKGMNLPF
jgi:nucleoid-associated protein EbfC